MWVRNILRVVASILLGSTVKLFWATATVSAERAVKMIEERMADNRSPLRTGGGGQERA